MTTTNQSRPIVGIRGKMRGWTTEPDTQLSEPGLIKNLSILRRKLDIANYPFGRFAGVAPFPHGNKEMCAMTHDP